MIAIFLRLTTRTNAFVEKLREVDWVGAFLFIASLTGFLIPLTWGGVMYSWSSWRTLVPLIVSAFGLVGFVVYEEWLAGKGMKPMIPLEVMKSRTALVTYFGTFFRESNF
jgi:hypothetical protein